MGGYHLADCRGSALSLRISAAGRGASPQAAVAGTVCAGGRRRRAGRAGGRAVSGAGGRPQAAGRRLYLSHQDDHHALDLRGGGHRHRPGRRHAGGGADRAEGLCLFRGRDHAVPAVQPAGGALGAARRGCGARDLATGRDGRPLFAGAHDVALGLCPAHDPGELRRRLRQR